MDIADIVKGLTEAQKRRLEKIADCPEGGQVCRTFKGHGNASCARLVHAGLAYKVGNHGLGGAYQITPLGLACRAHLMKETEND